MKLVNILAQARKLKVHKEKSQSRADILLVRGERQQKYKYIQSCTPDFSIGATLLYPG